MIGSHFPCGVTNGDVGYPSFISLVASGPGLVDDPATFVSENSLVSKGVELSKFGIVSKGPGAIINLIQVLVKPGIVFNLVHNLYLIGETNFLGGVDHHVDNLGGLLARKLVPTSHLILNINVSVSGGIAII